MRYLVYALLLLLYILHTDVWYWDDARMVLGLPVGITYHVLWTLAVSVCFALTVRYAWPEDLEAIAHNAPVQVPGGAGKGEAGNAPFPPDADAP